MKVVWKYPIYIVSNFTLSMPCGAKPLVIDWQYGELMMWALVDGQAPQEDRRFRILGTGQYIEDKDIERFEHVGTIQVNSGQYIWHLFVEAGAESGN